MLDTHLMERADYLTLEEREHTLGRVRVNIAAHVHVLAVVNRLVLRVLVAAALIGFSLVCVDAPGVGANLPLDEGVEGFAVAPIFKPQTDAAAPLDGRQHHRLA